MPWLMRDGQVLASLEVADSARSRARGLLHRDGIEGALLLPGVRSVHTIGMRFDLDVAFCDADMRVVRIVHMPRLRISRPVWHARCAIEAEAGAFVRWGLAVGDKLEVRE